MKPRYEYGTEVRLTRNVRNDGTYPGEEVGTLLIRRGEVGSVYDVGTYLQDQIIYRVHFLEAGRTVGCREEELILASDPWIPNRFEFREKVFCKIRLEIQGDLIAEQGEQGEIEKVVRTDDKLFYHARFRSRVFQMPESVLAGSIDEIENDAVDQAS